VTSQKPTRVGIVGTGAIARWHIAAAELIPAEVQITAICDPNESALRAAAAELPDAKLFASLEDLLDSGEIDAGLIATPHFLHADQAITFAQAGVDVLVEKPLVVNLDEIRELKAAAATSGSLVVAGQMHRFDPVNVLVRRWLDQNPGRFGDLAAFEMHCWQDITEYAAAVGTSHWLMDGRLAGGGVVVSLGVHQLDVVRYLGGADYAEVSARGSFLEPFRNGAESSASVLVTMDNGATGTIFASYNAPRAFASESFSLFGNHGGIGRQNRPFGSYLGPLLWASSHDKESVIDFSAIAGDTARPEASLIADLLPDRFANQLAHFARAVRGEVEPVNSLDENFNTIACIDAINRSLRLDGEPVQVARS
jgi:predicted dehydrogenase